MAEDMDISNSGKFESSGIDENLYSRQLYVMGHEAQRRMAVSDVLIVGLNGLGVETAKNVILAGVRSVTLYDDTIATIHDVGTQFYITEGDIGKIRSDVSACKLAELNPYVPVSVIKGSSALNHETLLQFSIVVLIEVSLPDQLMITSVCHQNNIAVICADARGVFGSIFCDFGESFAVHDVDGEPGASSIVASVTVDEASRTSLITVLEETRHNLSTGDVVTLSQLIGLEYLNDLQFRVTVKDFYSFEIAIPNEIPLSSNVQYVRGGYVNQVGGGGG